MSNTAKLEVAAGQKQRDRTDDKVFLIADSTVNGPESITYIDNSGTQVTVANVYVLPFGSCRIYVGTPGTITVINRDGSTVIIPSGVPGPSDHLEFAALAIVGGVVGGAKNIVITG